MNSSHDKPIVDPSFRPLDLDKTPPTKCRVAFTLLALGLLLLVVGTFITFNLWITFPSTVLVIVGLFLAESCRTPGEAADIRKL